jgi:hypothetical protein
MPASILRIRAFRIPLAIALLAALAAPSMGAGVYKWVDENGKVNFGDRPPLEGAETVNIHASPDQGGGTNAASAAERRERQRRLLDAYDTERTQKKARAEKEKHDKQVLEQKCQRARESLRNMQTATYLYDKDEKGNRRIYTDADRKKATDALQKKIKQFCG